MARPARTHGGVPGVVWVGLGLATAAGLVSIFIHPDASLPAFFMAMAAVMLLLALSAFWASLHRAFGAGLERLGPAGDELPERAALLDEKRALLQSLKDIAFEREVGKIGDDDFARLDRAYRRRAKEVLRELDRDLLPFLEEAERVLAEEVAASEPRSEKRGRRGPPEELVCPECSAANDSDAERCEQCGARIAPLSCGSCGTVNDPDASFCKKCASPLADERADADEASDDADPKPPETADEAGEDAG